MCSTFVISVILVMAIGSGKSSLVMLACCLGYLRVLFCNGILAGSEHATSSRPTQELTGNWADSLSRRGRGQDLASNSPANVSWS